MICGKATAAVIATTAMAIKSSIRVNPLWFFKIKLKSFPDFLFYAKNSYHVWVYFNICYSRIAPES
jgi:hypothetical protein